MGPYSIALIFQCCNGLGVLISQSPLAPVSSEAAQPHSGNSLAMWGGERMEGKKEKRTAAGWRSPHEGQLLLSAAVLIWSAKARTGARREQLSAQSPRVEVVIKELNKKRRRGARWPALST